MVACRHIKDFFWWVASFFKKHFAMFEISNVWKEKYLKPIRQLHNPPQPKLLSKKLFQNPKKLDSTIWKKNPLSI